MTQWANISDAKVAEKTGRGWTAWVDELNNAGAAALNHKEIAALLHARYGLDEWWAQSVTVGYEQATGRRAANQKAGGFSASVSRTVAMEAADAHAAWVAGAWMRLTPGAAITKATAPKSVRIQLADGTRAAVWLTAKAGGKTAMQVEHEKLPSAEAVEPSKALWRAVMAVVAGENPE